jgi:hypothetical protein
MRDVFQDASSVWERVSHFAAEIRESDFMAKMTRHLDQPGGHGLMGALDCATLSGLTRWRRPAVVVETGGYLGMSSAFILKALADEGLAEAKLYSLEMAEDCDHGALIPGELRSQFMPMKGQSGKLHQAPRVAVTNRHVLARQFASLSTHALGISPILGSNGRWWIVGVAQRPFQSGLRRIRRQDPGP